MPTSVTISAAVNEEAALVEWGTDDCLFHVVKAIIVFLLINLGRLE